MAAPSTPLLAHMTKGIVAFVEGRGCVVHAFFLSFQYHKMAFPLCTIEVEEFRLPCAPSKISCVLPFLQ